MSLSSFQQPIVYQDDQSRATYLRRVAGWTVGGLGLALLGAMLTTVLMVVAPELMGNRITSLVVMLGGMIYAGSIAQNMVFGDNKVVGFVTGSAAMGMALGYMLIVAASMAGGFNMILTALGATGIVTLSMGIYLWGNPKDLSMIGGALRVLWLPMLVVMGLSFFMPALFGGPIGIVFTLLFVVVSAAGLMYNLNSVMHNMSTNMVVEGGYVISQGLIVLFWNILSLLMRSRN